MHRRRFLKYSGLGVGTLMVSPLLSYATRLFSEQELIVETAYGKLKGIDAGGIKMFKGVPYAGSVAGERRFLSPGELKPWAGVRNATQLGAPAIQPPNQTYGINEPDPSEECLVLNIWTPACDMQKRPVMVYSHGGGYNTGSGGSAMQDGANLAQRYNVVVVETNHRLGLLGFMYLDEVAGKDYAGSGNRGVQDIAIALKWVNENIAVFGGDPDNVMIFGESGGGMKTSCLYAMPQAAPYFHKASIESGPGVLLKTADVAAQTTEMLLKDLGIARKDWRKLLQFSTAEILAAQARIGSLPNNTPQRGGFMGIGSMGVNGLGAVVDGVVLPHHPFEPVASPLSENKPLMTGWNEDEYIFFAMYGGDRSIFTLTQQQLETKLQQEFGAQADQILAVYRETNPGASPAQIYIAIRSILFMGLGSVQIGEQKAAQGGAPVYLYNFGYKSENKVPGTDYEMGAMHALDISFKFYNVEGFKDKEGKEIPGMAGSRPERYQAADNMASLWTSFAKNSVPQASGQPAWEAYTKEDKASLRIDTECKLYHKRYEKEIALWHQIYNS